MFGWVDIETTGLDDDDLILEVGLEVTRDDFTFLGRESFVILNDHMTMRQISMMMPEVVRNMHTKNGLIKELPIGVGLRFAEHHLAALLDQFSRGHRVPLCGNSVHFDRAKLKKYMPRFEAMFDYRNVDISTLKQLAERWSPVLLHGIELPHGRNMHRVLPDIEDSINEARFYKTHLF